MEKETDMVPTLIISTIMRPEFCAEHYLLVTMMNVILGLGICSSSLLHTSYHIVRILIRHMGNEKKKPTLNLLDLHFEHPFVFTFRNTISEDNYMLEERVWYTIGPVIFGIIFSRRLG